jgi:hypothetical protein
MAGVACSLVVMAFAADETVTGNLAVEGDLDIEGDSLSLGMRSDSSTMPGINLLYIDALEPSIYFTATRANASWVWQVDGEKSQMVLGGGNKLQLFDQSSTPLAKITLDPMGVSYYQNSVVINGDSNLLPNQISNSPYSIMTRGLGDARYVRSGSGGVAITGGSGGSYNAVSVAGGGASGDYSVSLNNDSVAAGSNTVAMTGGYTEAESSGASVAMNRGYSGAPYSLAVGPNSSAIGFGQVVVGVNNIPDYSASVHSESGLSGTDIYVADSLFIVGNGTFGNNESYDPTAVGVQSNAFVVKKTGDVWVGGGLDVTGDGRIRGKLRIPASGDLSMGSFTAGTDPAL